MTELQIEYVYQREALLKGYTCSNHVLIKVKAPSRPQEETDSHERPSMNLAIVLDRSGSMSGQPLEEAKQCAINIVNQMNESDRVAIVFYSRAADVLIPSTPVNNKAAIIDAIKSIGSGGNTNLHAGWEAGAKELLKHVSDYGISRVLLLSDGMANAGICGIEELKSEAMNMAQKGVSTSTYGLSRNFNEELMLAMANAGQGNAYYGETAADLHEPFMDEFAMISDLCVKSVKLILQPEPGVTIEVLNDLPYDDTTGAYSLANLPYDADIEVLAKLVVDKSITSAAEAAKLFVAHVHYNEVDSSRDGYVSASSSLSALPADILNMIEENAEVNKKKQEIMFSRLQQQAVIHTSRGNWRYAKRCLEDAKVIAGDDPILNGLVDELLRLLEQREESFFKKQAYYSSKQLEGTASSRLVDVPDYLQRKMRMGRNRNRNPN